jgi:hypothetical protein
VIGIGSIGANKLDFSIIREKPRWNDFRVVENEEMVRWKEVRKIAKAMVGDLACGAVDEHHT